MEMITLKADKICKWNFNENVENKQLECLLKIKCFVLPEAIFFCTKNFKTFKLSRNRPIYVIIGNG